MNYNLNDGTEEIKKKKLGFSSVKSLVNNMLEEKRTLFVAFVSMIVAALLNNEIVTLVLDQGGKEGLPVTFFGKTASMSTGAIRLGDRG